MEHNITARRRTAPVRLPLLLAVLLLLSACGTSSQEITYAPGTNGPEGSVIIQGLDAGYLEYTPTPQLPSGGFLYFASPRFLGPAFEGVPVEGTAYLNGNQISVDFVRGDDPDSGTVAGPAVSFTVDLPSRSVSDASFPSYEGEEITLTDAELCQIGTTLADIIQGAMEFHQS